MKKRLLSIVSILSILFVLIPRGQVSAENVSNKALGAYEKYFLRDKVKLDNVSCNLFNKGIEFKIKDINNDGTPEFILSNSKLKLGAWFYEAIYTYYNGKVAFVGVIGHGSYKYYKGTNIIMASSAYMGYDLVYYYKFNKGKLNLLANYADNKLSGETKLFKYYFIGDKKVTKNEYTKYINKMTKSKKSDFVLDSKMIPFTRENIKKYCSIH
ncbi:hypothetical protein [Clostridium oryzae]|uniref:Uncharacterized protein n=1 Tax=Clostridium oryzae TaxID=1450648 RepID=A0A1V4IEC3_9CLOT|nr:hypothetical protein [Clostridium oryzae]OPJ58303.1 hypothetical protein CLORY_36660 [Clostridium oryzae]